MANRPIPCLVNGCNTPVRTKGWCDKHYGRFLRHGSTDKPMKKVRPVRIESATAYVSLTRGFEAIIDAADAHLVDSFNWRALPGGNTIYAARAAPLGDGNQRTVRLHREIMDAPDDLEVDHINRNGLDNRRRNLRLATRLQNRHNSRTPTTNTSGFKGISLCPTTGKWRSQIVLEGKKHNLGRFTCPQDAHAAYCEASKRLHGEYGRTK